MFIVCIHITQAFSSIIDCSKDQNLQSECAGNQDNVQVYCGPDLAYTVKHLKPFTEYSFKVQSLVTDNNELSEFSEAVDVTTDESIPTEPANLRATGATMALIKVQWDVPAQMNGLIKGKDKESAK